jgi:hypothetical protein
VFPGKPVRFNFEEIHAASVPSSPSRRSRDEETDHEYHDARRGVEEPNSYGALGEVLRAFTDCHEGNPASALASATAAHYQHPEQECPSNDVGL